jgi:hypothetical protein
MITKVKRNINSVEVHPQLSNDGHPLDGALVRAGALWPRKRTLFSVSSFAQQDFLPLLCVTSFVREPFEMV